MAVSSQSNTKTTCYHCGENCTNKDISLQEKIFCCQGCKMVYEILNQYDLCEYYDLNSKPGVNQRIAVRRDKFAFLDDEKIAQQLYLYKDETQTHINFYIPQIHCSSCLWLLENLHKLEKGVQRVTVNFSKKEVVIIFSQEETSLRNIKNRAPIKNWCISWALQDAVLAILCYSASRTTLPAPVAWKKVLTAFSGI
jgi:Cu+-exporting ATPase